MIARWLKEMLVSSLGWVSLSPQLLSTISVTNELMIRRKIDRDNDRMSSSYIASLLHSGVEGGQLLQLATLEKLILS